MPNRTSKQFNWQQQIPYVGQNIPGNGFGSIIIRQALAKAGITFEPVFYPWRRVVDTLPKDANILGYYPELKRADLENRYYFSEPFGESPIGFVTMIGSAFDWQEYTDLENYNIGMIEGYSITPAFDQFIHSGSFVPMKINDEVTLLRMLSVGRLDAVIIDQNVMRYLVETVPDLSQHSSRFLFHANRLATRKLHVALKRTPDGARLLEILNEGDIFPIFTDVRQFQPDIWNVMQIPAS